MQAMRQISAEKRKSMNYIDQLFMTLCLTLEKRMVKHKFIARLFLLQRDMRMEAVGTMVSE